jgi:MFS family permease
MSHGPDSPTPADDAADSHAAASHAAGSVSAARRSLWHLPAMRLLAVYTITGFTGFFATMSALPAWIATQGTSDSLAGFVTTVLLAATVSTQSMVPRMMARLGMTTTLAIGLVALGAPSLLFLVDGGYWWVLAICALRGVGFGSMTVLGAMLTARIVPPYRRGEAIGIYGLAIAVPNLLVVPGGVALVSAGHFWVVALRGAAPLLGLPVVRALAKAAAGHGASPQVDRRAAAGAAAGSGAARQAARKAALGPALVLMVVTLTSGGFMTYLPIIRPDGALATAALLVWGAFGALTRWRIGPMADRTGLRALLPGSSVLSVVGICVVAGGLMMHGGASAVVVLIGAAVLGVGYGGTQNLTLVAAFIQARQKETATVSSVWNIGFDAGTALGSGLVGLLILAVTIPSALALTSLLILASLPLTIRAARPPLS